MMEIVYGNQFLKSASKLSDKNKAKLAKLLTFLQKNPFNPLLHTKHLVGKLAGLFSFRITRDWRVIFKFIEPKIIQLILVAHRGNIYKKK